MISQLLPPLEAIEYGTPAVLVGVTIGYAVGGSSHLSIVKRIGLAIAICLAGGLILSVLLYTFLPVTSETVLFVVLSFAGGYIFGTATHWRPPEVPTSKSHVIFEPDDDEEFDREIDEALGLDG